MFVFQALNQRSSAAYLHLLFTFFLSESTYIEKSWCTPSATAFTEAIMTPVRTLRVPADLIPFERVEVIKSYLVNILSQHSSCARLAITLKWRLIIKLFDILVVELQVHRRHVQTRMPEHLLQPPDVPAVSHAVDRI